MNSYWIDISIKGGWTRVSKIKAKSLKHALKLAETKFLNETLIAATETYETSKKKH